MNFPTISPEFDNLAEYVDPELYDVENAHFEPDGPFFLQLAQEVDGPVLELGCGTGRLGIPLLQQGIDYTGLDPMPQMLAHARHKSTDLPAQWFEADARSFQLEWQYQLIFDNGAAFVHVRTRADHEAVLAKSLALWRQCSQSTTERCATAPVVAGDRQGVVVPVLPIRERSGPRHCQR